jgi:hypothetical protein
VVGNATGSRFLKLNHLSPQIYSREHIIFFIACKNYLDCGNKLGIGHLHLTKNRAIFRSTTRCSTESVSIISRVRGKLFSGFTNTKESGIN